MSDPSTALLEVRGLHTAYGSAQVLHGVDLDVPRGEAVGLLGRNGMGKTTLVRAIMGIVPSQGGTIRFTADVPVVWSLAPGSRGTIDADGTYHAPSVVKVKNSFGGCQVLPNNHIINTRIDSLPLHANSASWINNMLTANGSTRKRVSFLSEAGGFPVNRVLPDTAATSLSFYYTPAYSGPFQFPSASEGGEIQGGWNVDPFTRDRHMLNVRPDTCEFSDIYNFYTTGANASCTTCNSQSGIKYKFDSYELPSKGATTAAGMQILPLILRFDELDRAAATDGSIEHALAISIHNGGISRSSKLWPAQSTANGWGQIPWGARLRLKASFT